VNRQTHELALINDRPLDVLPDPPGGIGAETKPPFVVEFLDRLDQPKIALFDDIREWKPAMNVALADADDETQIGLDHLLASLLVSGHDPFAQLLFLLEGQECRAADLAEIAFKGIQTFRSAAGFVVVGSLIEFGGILLIMVREVPPGFTLV